MRGIDDSDSALPAREAAKWRKPPGRPSGPEADDEHRLVVTEREEVVDGHGKAALRLRAAPGVGDRLQLAAKLVTELARQQHSSREARVLEPVVRLPHLADRASLEREPSTSRRSPRHRGTARAARAGGRARAAAPTRPGSQPASRGDRANVDERVDERVELGSRADRVARHDRDAADDAVGEERRTRRCRRSTTCRRAARTARACRRPRSTRARRRVAGRALLPATRWRHGASQPATIQAVAETPSSNSESGNQSPNSPPRWREPRMFRPKSPSAISRRANSGVNGWSAAIRLTQSAAMP